MLRSDSFLPRTLQNSYLWKQDLCPHEREFWRISGLLLYLESSREWEPPLEDTGYEAELRRQRALSAAVDVPSLMRSAQGYNPQRTGKVVCANSEALPSSLTFFLAEFPRKGHWPSRTRHDRDLRPSPHEVIIKGDGLPVISLKLQPEGNEQPTVRVGRERTRRKSRYCTPQTQPHAVGMLVGPSQHT